MLSVSTLGSCSEQKGSIFGCHQCLPKCESEEAVLLNRKSNRVEESLARLQQAVPEGKFVTGSRC